LGRLDPWIDHDVGAPARLNVPFVTAPIAYYLARGGQALRVRGG
jgi:hypothetical protein